MNYYKILNKDECHNGLQYHNGLNIDPVPFNPSGACQPGGMYFASKDILEFLSDGPWIRQVTLPDDAQIYKDPGGVQKWKADKFILGRRRKVASAKVIEELIADGVDFRASMDEPLRWACSHGHTGVVKILLKHGVSVHMYNDLAIKNASLEGYLAIVKLLVRHGANPHVDNEMPLSHASGRGHLDIVKYLVELNTDVKTRCNGAIYWACVNNHVEVVSYLFSIGIPLEDQTLKYIMDEDHMEVLRLYIKYTTKIVPYKFVRYARYWKQDDIVQMLLEHRKEFRKRNAS